MSIDTIYTCVCKSFFTHISVKAVITLNMQDLKSVNKKAGFVLLRSILCLLQDEDTENANEVIRIKLR